MYIERPVSLIVKHAARQGKQAPAKRTQRCAEGRQPGSSGDCFSQQVPSRGCGLGFLSPTAQVGIQKQGGHLQKSHIWDQGLAFTYMQCKLEGAFVEAIYSLHADSHYIVLEQNLGICKLAMLT